jgi:hypothetical protein
LIAGGGFVEITSTDFIVVEPVRSVAMTSTSTPTTSSPCGTSATDGVPNKRLAVPLMLSQLGALPNEYVVGSCEKKVWGVNE